MAFGITADPETAARLRTLTGQPLLHQVTVYDAEFPAEAGQQFVEALAWFGDDSSVRFDLTEPANSELNELLYELSCHLGTTCKFFVQLPA